MKAFVNLGFESGRIDAVAAPKWRNVNSRGRKPTEGRNNYGATPQGSNFSSRRFPQVSPAAIQVRPLRGLFCKRVQGIKDEEGD